MPQPATFLSAETAALAQTLRRCSHETISAALLFRHTRNSSYAGTIAAGIVTRYLDPELRAKFTTFSPELRLKEDLGIDSLTLVEISMTIEEALQVSLPDLPARELQTWADFTSLIDRCAQAPVPQRAYVER